MVVHNIEPIYIKEGENASEILILGSFPSVKSRESKFFYGHPQNRFWKVLARLFNEDIPKTIEEKKNLVIKHGIALWDVVYSCDISGSADSSIKNVIPTDLSEILSGGNIKAIFVNGKTAYNNYCRYQQKGVGKEAVCLPSTSPANAVMTIEKLVNEWSVILDYTK